MSTNLGLLNRNSATLTPSDVEVNVIEFGAVGDGVAIDTVAIQSAIDSLTNGGTVYFPEGDYAIDDTLLMRVGGLRIQGAGIQSTRITQTVASKHGFTFPDTSREDLHKHCIFADFNLLGVGGDTSTANGINVANGDESFFMIQPIFRDIRIEGFQRGLFIANTPLTTIDNCQFTGNLTQLEFAKADTFAMRNSSLGSLAFEAPEVTGFTTGLIMRGATGSPTGPNFAGWIEMCEMGQLDRLASIQDGSRVTFQSCNIERSYGDEVFLIGGSLTCVNFISNKLLGDSTSDDTGLGKSIWRIESAGSTSPRVYFRDNLFTSFIGWFVAHVYGGVDTYYCTPTQSDNDRIRYGLVYTLTSDPYTDVQYKGTMKSVATRRHSAGMFDEGDPLIRGVQHFLSTGDPASSPKEDTMVMVSQGKDGNLKTVHLSNDILSRNLDRFISQAGSGNVDGTALDAYTYQFENHLCDINGDTVEMTASGKFAGNANSKRVRIKTRTNTVLYDTGSQAFNGSDWVVDVKMRKSGNNNAVCEVRFVSSDPLLPSGVAVPILTNIVWADGSNNLIVEITGTSANDTVLHSAKVQWRRAVEITKGQ